MAAAAIAYASVQPFDRVLADSALMRVFTLASSAFCDMDKSLPDAAQYTFPPPAGSPRRGFAPRRGTP